MKPHNRCNSSRSRSTRMLRSRHQAITRESSRCRSNVQMTSALPAVAVCKITASSGSATTTARPKSGLTTSPASIRRLRNFSTSDAEKRATFRRRGYASTRSTSSSNGHDSSSRCCRVVRRRTSAAGPRALANARTRTLVSRTILTPCPSRSGGRIGWLRLPRDPVPLRVGPWFVLIVAQGVRLAPRRRTGLRRYQAIDHGDSCEC